MKIKNEIEKYGVIGIIVIGYMAITNLDIQ